jgi:hypothetical protein
LPHIVFNDPHVPWFREAGISHWMTDAVDTPTDTNLTPDPNGRNLMPWIGLLVFQPDELKVGDTDAKLLKLDGIKSYNASNLPANGAFAMTVGDYLSTIQSRVYYEAGYQGTGQADFKLLQSSTESMSAIFPTKSQLQSILGSNNDLSPLQAQRLLAHVRHINTIGFPDAGVEEEGYFSVVVSSMTGNQKEVAPSTHIVHLVSLEHIDSTLTNDASSYFSATNSDRIGLVSLFSWTYTCIPDAISFEETMRQVGQAAQPLRPPIETLEALKSNSLNNSDPVQAKTAKALYDRLSSGFTITRWRTPTGEETVSFNRGPLVPVLTQEVPTPQLPSGAQQLWPALSMTGKDYAVFDASVGIMDSTYSSAWSLGKLMAISDSVFNAAIMRFRSTVWADATSATRMATNGVLSKSAVLNNSTSAVEKAKAITGESYSGPVSRINVPANQPVAPPVNDPSVTPILQSAIDKTVNHLASAGNALFNGLDGSASNNSDWEIIQSWVYNVLLLGIIPAHVLFPEPSHLQSHNPSPTPKDKPSFYGEALRFFHIDHAWIDCFVDGALSCANHLEPKYDYTRLRIKAVFNEFLSTPVANTGLNPPVPRYGFILRSAVVKSTPDLRLTVSCWMLHTNSDGTKHWVEDPNRDPLIRHTKMDDFTILSLVDCSPEEIYLIKFAQPPHQQRYALNGELVYDANTGLVNQVKPDITLKRLYTDSSQAPSVNDSNDGTPGDNPLEWKELDQQIPETDQTDFYSVDTRCIKAFEITKAANDKVLAWAKEPSFGNNPPYNDVVPNSCVFGLELNDPSCKSYQKIAPR